MSSLNNIPFPELTKISDFDNYFNSLESYYLSSPNKYFFCPFCFKNIPLILPFINRSSSSLNLFLICPCGKKQIIHPFQIFSAKIPPPPEPEKKVEKFCQICKSNHNSKEIKYCLFCDLWICKICREEGFKKEEENHCFSDQKIFEINLCKTHELYKNKFFCFTCNIPICFYCLKQNHSKHHTISDIDFHEEADKKFKKLYTSNTNVNNDIDNKNNINDLDLLFLEEKTIDKEIVFKNLLDKIRATKNLVGLYEKLCEDENIEKDETIKEYLLKNLKINVEIYFFLKFTYERFLLSKGFLNFNLINNMINLIHKNFTNLFNIDTNKYNSSNILELNYSLKNYLYTNFLINFKKILNFETLSESSSFEEEEQKINEIIKVDESTYLYISSYNLMYNDTIKGAKSKFISEGGSPPPYVRTSIYDEGFLEIRPPLLIPKQRSMSLKSKRKRSSLNENMDNNNINTNKDDFSEDIFFSKRKISHLLLVGKDVLLITCGEVIEKYKMIKLLLNPEYSLIGHKTDVRLLFANSENKLISVSEDNVIKIWELVSNKCLFTISHPIYSFFEDVTEPNLIYCGNKKGFISLDINKGYFKNFCCHKDIVNNLLMNKNKKIITGSFDGFIKLFDINKNEIETKKEVDMSGKIKNFSKINEKIFAVIVENKGLSLFNYYEGLILVKYINLWKEKIVGFVSLGNGFFFKENDQGKYKLIKAQNIEEELNELVIFN